MKISDECDSIRAVQWQDNSLILLDQRELPHKESYQKFSTSLDVSQAIQDMVVRGAPAIGIAAAYGFVMAVNEEFVSNSESWRVNLESKISILLASRPTAVNLKWAIDRLKKIIDDTSGDPRDAVLNEAHAINKEDYLANVVMGNFGADYIRDKAAILTHCNTGSLATGGYGTALGVIRTLFDRKNLKSVFVSETRPWLQGSRLTMWELERDNIPATLIADSSAAVLMQSGKIDWVIIGADRIAVNGDVANKIGSYSHAVNARFHNIKFMVVAPVSTIDISTLSGEEIEIEDRGAKELTTIAKLPISIKQASAFNPVFDITPADMVSVLVTERGVIEAPDEEKIRAFLDGNY
jgi:methylthioribose-1-phosphate isomerase